jgi:dethiobiotin synthetase
MSQNNGIFVVGTGTDVGKTYVTALLIKHLRQEGINANYYKAAVSGNARVDGELIPGDALFVKNFANLSTDLSEMVSYVYEEPLSPHLAARKEENFADIRTIKADFRKICRKSDFVVVEGSGGILCPLVYDDEIDIWLEDVIRILRLPVVVVADAGLGTINSTGLTVSYLRRNNFKMKGIILNNFDENNFMHIDNKRVIEEITRVPVIATVRKSSEVLNGFDSQIIYERRD